MKNKLINSYVFLFLLQMLFVVSYYAAIDYLIFLTLILNIFATIFVYFNLRNNYHRLLILAFMSFAMPKLSFPINDDIFSTFISNNIFIESDRFLIGVFMFSLFGFLFFLQQLHIAIKLNNDRIVFFTLLFLVFFIAVIFSHDYNTFSYINVFLDFFYFLNIASILLFFKNFKQFYNLLYDDMLRLFRIFAYFIVFDIIICFTDLIPHTSSYRNGLQGFFYAFELPYSFILLILSLYFLSHKNFIFKTIRNNQIFKFLIFIIFSFLIFKTNIKTSALVLALIYFIRFFNFGSLKYKRFLIFLLFPIVIFNYTTILNNNLSLAARSGINDVYVEQLLDGDFFTGIMPGITQFYLKSNLAVKFNSGNWENYIQSDNVITSEIITRSKFEDDQGAFIPHNIHLSLLSSYGLIMLPFILFLFYYIFKVIFSANYDSKKIDFIMSFLFCSVLISFFHPYFLYFEIIFCLGLLNNLNRNNELSKYLYKK
jgi:hypothetical protein